MTNNKQKTKIKAIVYVLLAFLLVMCCIPVAGVYADTLDYSIFDKSEVFADLESKVGFDYRQYPKDSNGSIQILDVVEYCYSENAAVNKYYGLYIYVYNPTAKNVLSIGNSIQMATAIDDSGIALEYEKLQLQLLSTSSDLVKNLFVKFKVGIPSKLLNVVKAEKRSYIISSIEVNLKPEMGTALTTDYPVGGKWIYTGFAEGCATDPKAESNLNCVIEQVETISLDLTQSSYLTNESALGEGHRNQISSVAFNVPNRFFDSYGELQKISAEWHEYRTEPILITSELDIYNSFVATKNKPIKAGSTDYSYCPFGFEVEQSANEAYYSIFNRYNPNLTVGLMPIPKPLDSVHNVFYITNGDIANYIMPRETLLNYFKSNKSTVDNGGYSIGGGYLSKNLVYDGVGSGRTAGYNKKVFDAGDSAIVISHKNEQISAWTRFWSIFDKNLIKYDKMQDVSPIYLLQEKDLASADTLISSGLMWGLDDVQALKTRYRLAKSSDSKTVVFRFAITDYFSKVANVFKNGGAYLGDGVGDTTELTFTEQNVFFDFDIIDLTFKKDGVFTVIPTANSPIDIVGPVEPPLEDTTIADWFEELGENVKEFFSTKANWWKILLMVIGVIIGFPILIFLAPFIWKFLKAVVKLIVFIVCLPVKAVIAIVRKIKEGKG